MDPVDNPLRLARSDTHRSWKVSKEGLLQAGSPQTNRPATSNKEINHQLPKMTPDVKFLL